MKPIINPWLIYLAGICDPIKIVLGFFGFMLTIICIVLLCFILSESLTKDEEHKYLKYIKKTIIACISCIVLTIMIPSQQTVYTIAISSQITVDNIKLLGGTGKDIIEYLTDQIAKITNNESTKGN